MRFEASIATVDTNPTSLIGIVNYFHYKINYLHAPVSTYFYVANDTPSLASDSSVLIEACNSFRKLSLLIYSP